jgi:phytol kinase
MLTNAWLAIAVLASLLLALLVVLRVVGPRLGLGPESSRKIAHIGLGLTTLTFPFLFKSVWPVAILVAMTILVLAAIRWIPPLRGRFGKVVDGVPRQTGGGLYFPIAAGLLFIVAKGDPIGFGVPILTLTFADAAAALIGVHYGKLKLQKGSEAKTVEGSIAFFSIAFLTTHIPILLFTTTGRLESLLIGVIFGVIVMLMEAVSLWGTDNLLIPFGGYLLLEAFLKESVRVLAASLAVIVLLLMIVLLLRKRRTLSDSAVLAGVLVGFVSWAAGGWPWVVPPLVVFLTYTVFWPRKRLVRQRPHEVIAIVAVSSGLLWLLAAVVLGQPSLYYAYTISFAAHMCFIGITWYRLARPRLHRVSALLRSALTSWAAMFIPFALVERNSPLVVIASFVALLCLIVASTVYTYFIPHVPGGETRWGSHSAIALAASVLGFAILGTAAGSVQ